MMRSCGRASAGSGECASARPAHGRRRHSRHRRGGRQELTRPIPAIRCPSRRRAVRWPPLTRRLGHQHRPRPLEPGLPALRDAPRVGRRTEFAPVPLDGEVVAREALAEGPLVARQAVLVVGAAAALEALIALAPVALQPRDLDAIEPVEIDPRALTHHWASIRSSRNVAVPSFVASPWPKKQPPPKVTPRRAAALTLANPAAAAGESLA